MDTPADNNQALIAFYGDPSSRVFAMKLVPFVPPWQMLYNDDGGKIIKVTHFVVHALCLDAFKGAFNKIWADYGMNQSKIEADNLQWYGGCYAPRNVRGSEEKLSCHAFAAAIDLDPEHEPMNRKHESHMSQIAIDAFKGQGFTWGGDFHSRQDPMHFQLAHE